MSRCPRRAGLRLAVITVAEQRAGRRAHHGANGAGSDGTNREPGDGAQVGLLRSRTGRIRRLAPVRRRERTAAECQ